ncbi:MAG TPA: SCO family protein [Gaiellaceae bacterium]|nr:SCO family protein [Gaiellaceae bacterium]
MPRWWPLVAAIAVGATAGLVIALTRNPSEPQPATGATAGAYETWAPGARRARSFTLRDDRGAPISVPARGSPTVVTFLDPVCRSLCPVEARILASAVRELGPLAPQVVSVSVDPPADTPANFRTDAREWRLPPSWRWAVGSTPVLARVWQSYGVSVEVQQTKLAGVSVRNVVHDEEAYLVDRSGFVRALFIFPFRAQDVERAVRAIGSAR